MLGLNFFKIEPTNRLGAMFKKMLRERKLTGLRYNDLSEVCSFLKQLIERFY